MGKGRVSMTASQISDKWGKNLKAAVPFITQGVDAVTENPMTKAVANSQKMVDNLTAAVSSGRYAAGCNAVTLQDWKDRTKSKVTARLASGVDAGMPKRQKFDVYLVGALNNALPTINSMPSATFEDSINRVRAMMEAMHNNPYKK
jgi:hypothetical protein